MQLQEILDELATADSKDLYPNSWDKIEADDLEIDTEKITVRFDVRGNLSGTMTSTLHWQDPEFEDDREADTYVTIDRIFDEDGELDLSGDDIEKIATYINDNLLNIEI